MISNILQMLQIRSAYFIPARLSCLFDIILCSLTMYIHRVNGSLKSLQVIIESGRADVCALTADRQTPLILAVAKASSKSIHTKMCTGYSHQSGKKLTLFCCIALIVILSN